MSNQRIVIIGAGYAGAMTAIRLYGKTRSPHITLVNAADHFVERIRLHQLAANQKMRHFPLAKLLKGIQLVQGWVTGIAPDASQISVKTAAGEQVIAYDYLVYALGSTVDTETVPGVREYALTVGDENRTLQLQAQLRDLAARGGQVVIGGGGLTGIETATEIAETYPTLHVSLITRDTLLHEFSSAARSYALQVFAKLGIHLIEQQTITRVHPHALEMENYTEIPFDLCIWAGAFRVAPLARAAGITVNTGNQILVDEALRSLSHPNIYAAGDAASLEAVWAMPTYMTCSTAMPMGAYVADQLAAVIKGKPAPAPFRFGYVARCVSLGRRNAFLQLTRMDHSPREMVFTGWLGVQFKEMICRGVVQVLHLERHLPGAYSWLQPTPQKAITSVVTELA